MMAFKVIAFLSVLSDAASPSDTTFMPRQLQRGCTTQGYQNFLKKERTKDKAANRYTYRRSAYWHCNTKKNTLLNIDHCNILCKDLNPATGLRQPGGGKVKCVNGDYSFVGDFIPCPQS